MNVWPKIFGYKGYRQFVVICHPRTGSNLLSTYLNAHANIKMHGEMFRYLHGQNINDIYKIFRKKKLRRIKASGFKLFYTHPEDGNNEEVLQLIERMPAPLIIHLIRKDKLRTLVSWKIALLTDVWGLKKEQPIIPVEKKIISITPEEALYFLSELTKHELRIEQRFKKQNLYLRVSYEDLMNNPEDCMHAIFTSLGLSDQPLYTKYQKSNPEPLHELISNYQELVDKGIVAKFDQNKSLQ